MKTSKTQSVELKPCDIVEKLRQLDRYADRMNAKIQKKRNEYLDLLTKADDDAYDWISVKEAAALRHLSVQAIYARKDLDKKYFGSSMSVRRSQVLEIDDK